MWAFPRSVAIPALVALTIATSATALGDSKDPAGSYDLAGQTVASTPYEGRVEIEPSGRSFLVDWRQGGPANSRGFALRLGDVLGVAADDREDDFGIVLYRVDHGHLEGIWNGYPNARGPIGRETLDGPASLDGSFKISRGVRPDNGEYGGHVEIKRAGQTYLVDWYAPSYHYIGTGVMMGNVFVVGYAYKHRPTVAAYCLESEAYVGVTASGEDQALGAEILWPHGKPAPEGLPARLTAMRQNGAALACGTPVVDHPRGGPAILQSAQASP